MSSAAAQEKIKEIDSIVLQIVKGFEGESMASLKKNIVRRKVISSGSLLSSLLQDSRIKERGVVVHHLSFNEYGRLQELKFLNYGSTPPIQSLIRFVEEVGLAKFKRVPGYANRSEVSSTQAVKRIAWGIAMSKLKQVKKKRVRKWYSKTYYKEVNELLTEISVAVADHIVELSKLLAK